MSKPLPLTKKEIIEAFGTDPNVIEALISWTAYDDAIHRTEKEIKLLQIELDNLKFQRELAQKKLRLWTLKNAKDSIKEFYEKYFKKPTDEKKK